MSINNIAMTIFGILFLLGLSYFVYKKYTKKADVKKIFGLHILIWIILNAASFLIPFMPATIIFSHFYRVAASHMTDGIYVFTALMLYLPFINSFLMLLLSPVLLNLQNRRTLAP